jgi:hypothetical protein
MSVTDRRALLWTGAALPLAMATSNAAFPQAAEGSSNAPASQPPVAEVTRILARYPVTATYDDLPEKARKEGARTLLNWVGVAIGGSRHQTIEGALWAR